MKKKAWKARAKYFQEWVDALGDEVATMHVERQEAEDLMAEQHAALEELEASDKKAGEAIEALQESNARLVKKLAETERDWKRALES